QGNILLEVDFQEDVPDNQYQWYVKKTPVLQGTAIEGATGTSYQATSSGIYYYIVTNPRVPLLTIYSKEKVLFIKKS
ncbi:MAG TPA: hypothetical protein V6D20_24455, partial [Candidatus Obscuribacterales bacterium]